MRIEDEIDIWLRTNKLKRVFPREVSLRRKVVKDEVEFYGYLFDENWHDVYANVFAQWQKAYSKFDTVLVDIDEHSLPDYWSQIEVAFEVMGKVRDILEKEGLYGRWYFTGRGFHVYIDFPLSNIEYYTEIVRYDWAKELFDKMKKNIDLRVVGDKNRMARLVGSVHSKTGLTMIRIEPEWELEKIVTLSLEGKNEAKYIDNLEKNMWFAEYLKEMDMRYREQTRSSRPIVVDDERKKAVYEFVKVHGNSIEMMPPCIKEGIRVLLETGELFHEWRFHIAAYLLRVWDRSSVEKLFEMANDYNPSITKYQLDYIERRKLYPYGCRKAKLYGICPVQDQKKCPFYDLFGKWIGGVFKDVENGGV